jgi:spore germination protein
MFIHVVGPGETLYRIAQKYGVSIDSLIENNGLTDPNMLVIGQTLIIIKENTEYVVQSGDTLSKIAGRFSIPVEVLYQANDLSSNAVIYPGDVLKIVFTDPEKREMEINGYVYPEVDIETLKLMLPQLTYLSIFAYPVQADGNLIAIEDENLIKEARNYRVAPMMVIANITDGTFSSDIASSILNNEMIQDRLIENILTLLKAKNYYGLDIDFEYLYPKDRKAYNRFLQKITTKLHQEGFIVTTAIAPKTSAEQLGLLYEAHDYPAHGRIVDHVIIMTYEWGYLWSEAMPVAPIDRVEEVISYAVREIPSEKILMGIPNYGYDFNVPKIEDVPARLITNYEAIEIAKREGVGISFDRETMSPFFTYIENGNQREVHFEDAKSIKAKIMLALEYNLGGFSIWTIMSYFRPMWLLFDYYLKTKKVI